MAKDSNIIIKKIKKGGHGGHAAAWKIAYADFVTAMMAFFLLLWLLSVSSKETLVGIASYFAPTMGLKDKMGIGFEGGVADMDKGQQREKASNQAIIFGAPTIGSQVEVPKRNDVPDKSQLLDIEDHKNFSQVQNDLYQAIEQSQELKDLKDNVVIEETPEGLRISISDHENKPMFKEFTAEFYDYTKNLLTTIAKYIKFMPNYLSIAGHTNSVINPNIDNWSLSTNRSLAVRKFLVDGLIDREQIFRIEGKADQEPADPQNPTAIKNIRFTLTLLKNSIVPFQKRSVPDNILSKQEPAKQQNETVQENNIKTP